MTDLRFGILGSGGRGRFAAHAHKPGEGSKVVACCDVKDFVLEQNKEAYGADCFTTTDVETFIGQDMDEEQIRKELDACLSTDEEIASGDWKEGYDDDWPVERAYALN